MTGQILNVKISGISSSVPSREIDNSKYEATIGKRQFKRQTKLTGVFRKRISGKYQRASDLCCGAARPLLKKLGWKADDIQVLVMVTQTPNYVFPSTAFLVAKQLGVSKDCVCFDMNLGCSSFPVGVQMVASLLQNCDSGSKGLLVMSDIVKELCYPESKVKKSVVTHNMLFGSAGAAVALEKVSGGNGLKILSKSDGDSFDAIIHRYGLPVDMDGSLVFDFAINDVSDDVMKFKEQFGLAEEDIDYYVFHQAQNMILNAIQGACNLPPEKELRSIEKYGNTSGTSVPVSICANKDLLSDRKSVRLLCCGFGVGLSWGIVYADVETENILSIVETDEHYDEDKLPSGPLKKKTVLVFGADTEMGECISRYLSSQSAEVVLIGKDKTKLEGISQDLVQKTYVYGLGNETPEEMLEKIDEDTYKYPVLSTVFCAEYIDWAQVEKAFECLNQDEDSKIRLLMIEEKSQRRELKKAVEKLDRDCKSETMTVNGITYDSDKLALMQFIHEGSEWMDEFVQRGCPDDMKRQFHVGIAARYLLGDWGEYISGTVVNIER